MKRYVFRKFEKGDQSLVIQVAKPVPPYSDIGKLVRKTKGEKWSFWPSVTCWGIDIDTMKQILAYMEVGK